MLIFERIREELRAGKPAATALTAGFSKAFATLVDTHVTTVVSCAFLFFFGAKSTWAVEHRVACRRQMGEGLSTDHLPGPGRS